MASAASSSTGDSKADAVAAAEQQRAGLEEFSKGDGKVIPDSLIKVISDVASCGEYVHDWPLLRTLLCARLDQVLVAANARVSDCPDRPYETFKEKRHQLLDALRDFELAPFTLQRLCELLMNPHRQYNSTNKLIAGFDKLLSVSSTYPPIAPSDRVLPPPAAAAQIPAADDAMEGYLAASPTAGSGGATQAPGVASDSKAQASADADTEMTDPDDT